MSISGTSEYVSETKSSTGDYCASKAATVSLHESLRYELDNRYKCPSIRTTLIVPGHIQTPLFSRLPSLPANTSSFYKFFTPSLQPVTVVKRIIAALDERHSRVIFMPFYTQFVPYLPILPSFARDFVQWVRALPFCP